MKRRQRHPRQLFWTMVVLGGAFTLPAWAVSKKITTEAVNAYSTCGPTNLNNSIANNAGFRNTMIVAGGFWSAGLNRENQVVSDNHLYDPELTSGTDTSNFDRPGDAIAYFTGHGVCDGATEVVCTGTSQCTHPEDVELVYPGSTATMPGSCKQGPPGSGFPPIGTGWCHYLTPRHAITCGTYVGHNNDVNYSGGLVRWGESSNSGSWAGAGNNGGVNLVVLDVSCGVNPTFWGPQLTPAFGGLHLLATMMPVTGDTANTPYRGSTFAAHWAANQYSGVADSWGQVVADLGGGGGNGGGLWGAGCNAVVSYHGNSQMSSWYVTSENWVELKNDSYDATSGGFFNVNIVCNYDAVTYPWSLDDIP
jgi:hypothetical protein